MITLSIDPGKTSGFALIANGKVVEAGELHIDTAKGLALAVELVDQADAVAIEDVGYVPSGKVRIETMHHLGVRAGAWACLARQRGLEVQWVHPNTWQRAMLHRGGRNPGRAMLKRLSMARARQESGRVLGENASDAVCLGLWADREMSNHVKP